MDAFAVVLVGAAMVLGTIGTIVPLLPGIPIVWAAALVYGLVEGSTTFGWVVFGAITVVAAGGMVAGAVLPHRRAAAAGVPRSSIWAGLGLGIVGFFVIPVIGLPLGAAAGIYAAERSRSGDAAEARRATKALLVGFGLGALVQFGAGVVMTALWVVWVLA